MSNPEKPNFDPAFQAELERLGKLAKAEQAKALEPHEWGTEQGVVPDAEEEGLDRAA